MTVFGQESEHAPAANVYRKRRCIMPPDRELVLEMLETILELTRGMIETEQLTENSVIACSMIINKAITAINTINTPQVVLDVAGLGRVVPVNSSYPDQNGN